MRISNSRRGFPIPNLGVAGPALSGSEFGTFLRSVRLWSWL
jgi:hypothetical protein